MKAKKIPQHAKRVFKGKVFEIFQWEQQMFTERTKVFEFAKRLDGAGIIATVGNKIVVLRQKQPNTSWYYTLPGGYMDEPGESPKQCALRELLEETGLKSKKMKLWKTYKGGGRVHSNYYIFIAQDCQKLAEQELDGGEIIEVQLKSFNQFLKMADEPTFNNWELIPELLRARLYPKKKAELKKLIFG